MLPISFLSYIFLFFLDLARIRWRGQNLYCLLAGTVKNGTKCSFNFLFPLNLQNAFGFDWPYKNCFAFIPVWITTFTYRLYRHGTHDNYLAPNVWLASSVGRATHRQRGGHRFESRWSPDFFSGFFFPIASIGKFIAMIILQFRLQPQIKNELSHILHIISLLMGDMYSINWPRSQCVAS